MKKDEKQGGKKILDLSKYEISCEGVAFEAGNKKGTGQNMLMREETFDQFIEMVRCYSPIETAFMLIIYKKIVVRHKPYIFLTFAEIAEELHTNPRVIRRYSKKLMVAGILQFAKLEKCDSKIPNQYVFTMGPKFQKWIWKSKLFEKAKQDYVDNSSRRVDESQYEKNERVHAGPLTGEKGSMPDPQWVHAEPPQNDHNSGIIEESGEIPPLSSLMSSINMSSVEGWGETNVSHMEQEAKKAAEKAAKEAEDAAKAKEFLFKNWGGVRSMPQ
jgi:hypothetical protein